MSHSGRTDSATSEKGRVAHSFECWRVKFFIETPAILWRTTSSHRLVFAALAARILLGGRVDFTELHELIVVLAADFRNERTLMADVL